MFKNAFVALTTAAVLLAATSQVFSQDAEPSTVVKIADVSAAARKIIHEQVGKGKLGKIEKVNQDGVVIYDVEIRKGGKERSFTVSDDGDLLDMEVFIGEVPEPVRAGIKQRLASGELEGITKVFEDDRVSFEADISRDGKSRTFTFDPQGTLTEMELFLNETPAPVQQAIQRVLAARKLGDITEIFDDGETNYEVEINPEEKGPVITFDPKGTLITIEEAVAQSKLPEPVQKTLSDQLKGDRLVSLTKVTEDGEVSYNADIRRAGKWETVTIGADGKVIP